HEHGDNQRSHRCGKMRPGSKQLNYAWLAHQRRAFLASIAWWVKLASKRAKPRRRAAECRVSDANDWWADSSVRDESGGSASDGRRVAHGLTEQGSDGLRQTPAVERLGQEVSILVKHAGIADGRFGITGD